MKCFETVTVMFLFNPITQVSFKSCYAKESMPSYKNKKALSPFYRKKYF